MKYLAPLVALASALIVTQASAGTEKTWTPLVRGAMPQGEAAGVAPVSDGTVRLAPKVRELGTPDSPYLWGVARTTNGAVYAVGGDTGIVYRLEKGKVIPAHTVSALGVNAIIPDGKNVIIATGPDGKVLRLDSRHKTTELFNPAEKYIWDIVSDRRHLYVATGTPGRVYQVPKNGGKARRLYDSEAHVRTLAMEKSGTVLAGTDGRGLLVRIDPKGRAFVLYDTPRREVSSIAVAADGTVYFAAVGSEKKFGTDKAKGPKAILYSMRPDGFVEELWKSPTAMIYSLAVAPDGEIWVAAGAPGEVYVVDALGVARRIWEAKTAQVTDLTVAKDGVYAVTGSPSRIVHIPWSASGATGEFLGKPLDAKGFAKWGRANLHGAAVGGTIQVFMRSGNTADPDDTWSPWSAPLGLKGGDVKSPPARYLQWKVNMTSRKGAEPSLQYLEVFYRPANRAPKVSEVTIERPGLTLRPKPRNPEDGESPDTVKPDPSRKGWEPGHQALKWKATDPDGDTLVYDVHVRPLGAKPWSSLVEGQLETYFTFDASAIADGLYELRITARDTRSNSGGDARSGERVEGPMTVDTTPPTVAAVSASVARRAATVKFSAADVGGGIARAEVSLDGKPWVLLTPDDGLTDEGAETFKYRLAGLEKGDYTVVVRVTDRAGNSSAKEARFTLR